ncbi:Signal transducer regulating beta-lactamase production, contains metallopeptidase domain [Paenibacillus sp. UNCCL117]|uniref:M56 family metallopeptidase n=1 Tax=unclassified Paenibacillus TaxID=185978 RepID=UPI0008859BE1|nr:MULTISPECIES: M56 family metallopeptidase [unclassified Paenibacillus]SDC53492.1 Signal transducer regulating beta-lactamase production, contains metallopeptidase domain [Paenibacillus sp. cl123]SFW11171.1 Signal transducer regulating beta-lactamase production, contains metallopeptidase domain [Paenibacillus sp. UNCCL117]
MLIDLFTQLLLVSATTSLLVIALTVCSPLLRKHFTAKWIYWMWIVLAIRLLLPVNYSLPNPLIEFQVPEPPRLANVWQAASASQTPFVSDMAMQPMQQTAASPTSKLLSELALIWLVGCVLYLLYHVIGYGLFKRQAFRWSKPVTRRIVHHMNRISNEMKLRRPVRLLTSEKVPNPMLVGVRKPVLFLPHERFNETELDFILRHELVHYKRHDGFYKLILLLVNAVHWFNPFVWRMVREAGREIEIYCDDTVVHARDLAYRKKYCEAILSAMQGGHPRFSALSIHFSGDKNSMKQRFQSILSMKKRRNDLFLFCTMLMLLVAVGVLAVCTNGNGVSSTLKSGTYAVDPAGNITLSFQNGAITAKAPLQLDTTGREVGMGASETGFFVSEEKTAIVYGFADGAKPLHALVSDDQGKTWNEYTINGAKGYDTKWIGFISKNEGWIVAGGTAGVGQALNYVYQTHDGGKSWKEVGNPNEQYAEQAAGAGFSNSDVGFISYRYYEDKGPIIYWTKDQGKSWSQLTVTLPQKFDAYLKTPLSPTFNGKNGKYPIALTDHEKGTVGTIFLSSNDGGLTWEYDSSGDELAIM